MPTLQELKDKWFLTENQFEEYGLTIRHPNSLCFNYDYIFQDEPESLHLG